MPDITDQIFQFIYCENYKLKECVLKEHTKNRIF